MNTRRTFVIGAVAAAAVSIGPAIRTVKDIFAPLPAFSPLGDPAGFRRIAGGQVSSAGNFLIGLDTGQKPRRSVSAADIRANPCRALYGSIPQTDDIVAIASFSDYYCPYCRIQTRHLAELAADPAQRIRVSWHELPLLGHASVVAAKAALAAERQDAYTQFHDRLLGTRFQPTPSYLRKLAAQIGIDPDRLIADMNGGDVQHALDQSAALAELFGLIGTPSMVIGRTVVQGRISDRTLLNLIENERQTGWTQVC
ncbi:DsbA family protein [Primorskyibacter marinus]|uniref:DsbA family protein n=1 Tax=Primorskyibacter marinus TaxID=1977320 RepID=UPI0013001C36|nr:DsbA family protein [Primorskyibacter marinus]